MHNMKRKLEIKNKLEKKIFYFIHKEQQFINK